VVLHKATEEYISLFAQDPQNPEHKTKILGNLMQVPFQKQHRIFQYYTRKMIHQLPFTHWPHRHLHLDFWKLLVTLQ